MKKRYLALICLIIFGISFFVYYLPIKHKGYPYDLNIDTLLLARNLSLTGKYSVDNSKNIYLSSGLIATQGIESKLGNKLSAYPLALYFKIFGFNQNVPIYFNMVLYSLVNVLLFLLVLKLFKIKIALIFSSLSMFFPTVVQNADLAGFCELAMFFFTIALLIYLYQEKPGWIKLIIAGLFFGLAIMSYNAFLLSVIPFIIYEFYKNRSLKRIILLVLPIIILFGIFVLPNNSYLSKQETTIRYLHLFPDPYTYYYERDAYVQSIQGTTDYDYNQFLIEYGYKVSLVNKFKMYLSSVISYPSGLINLTIYGGPILILLMVAGFIGLYREKKYLAKLFLIWGIIWYLLLIFEKSNHWGHFVQLVLPVGLMVALGVAWLFSKLNLKNYWQLIVILALIGQLIIGEKWMFHEKYEYGRFADSLTDIKQIESQLPSIDKNKDVIAVGTFRNSPQMINYYTDTNTVYFDPATIDNLLKEKKLDWAFKQFGVTKFIGYSDILSAQIVQETTAEKL